LERFSAAKAAMMPSRSASVKVWPLKLPTLKISAPTIVLSRLVLTLLQGCKQLV